MFTKFASFNVTSSVLVPLDATATQGLSMVKQSHRVTFDYEVRPGFLYVRSRAISSRCNDNFDEFPAEEIKKGYKTFVGKPVFVNHNNENHRRARGVIIDAVLHEDTNPDGSPDTWAEVLMEVDAVNFPKLADAIQKGHIDRTSMGTDVAYSICSACGNKATSPAEYCVHIPRQKGSRLYKADPKTGSKEGILIREICYGLSFFENSLLVEEPADPTAFFLGVDTRGVNKAASKTAHVPLCDYCDGFHDSMQHFDKETENSTEAERIERENQALSGFPQDAMPHSKNESGFYDENRFYKGDKFASKTAHLDHEDFQMGPSKPGKEPTSHAHVPVSDEDREFYRQMVEQREHDSELSEQAEKRVVNTKDHIDLMQHMIEAHDRYPEDHDFARKNPVNTDALGESDEDMDRDLTHAEMQKVHDHEHGEYPDDFPTATTLDGSHFHTARKTAADNPVFLAPDSPTPDDNQDLSDEEWKQQNSNQWGPNIAGRVRSEWRKRIKSALNQHGVPYERFLKKTKDIHGWGSELRILHHYGTMLQEDPYRFHDVAKGIANLSNNKKTSSQNPRTLPFIEKFQSLQKVACEWCGCDLGIPSGHAEVCPDCGKAVKDHQKKSEKTGQFLQHFAVVEKEIPVAEVTPLRVVSDFNIQLREDGNIIITARENDQILATAMANVSKEDKQVRMTSLEVRESSRGRGFGSNIVRLTASLPEYFGLDDSDSYTMRIIGSTDEATSFYDQLGAKVLQHYANVDTAPFVIWGKEARQDLAQDATLQFESYLDMSDDLDSLMGDNQSMNDKPTDVHPDISENDLFVKRGPVGSLKRQAFFEVFANKLGEHPLDLEHGITQNENNIHLAQLLQYFASPMGGSKDSSNTDLHQDAETSYCTTCNVKIFKVNDGSINPWQHDLSTGAGVAHQAVPRDEDIDKTSAKNKNKMTPEELAQREQEETKAKKWVASRNNQPSTNKIIDAWNSANDDEKKTGMTWYEDTHKTAKHLADQTGADVGTMAGLISNYSPQTHWHTNIVTAAKVARTKVAVGGKGEGVMASKYQKEKARRMLSGEHWKDIFSGPKTRAFAHLIEHGGNADDSDPQVAVDRHAYSVAIGKRVSDIQYSFSGLGAKRKHAAVAQKYIDSARILSKREGYEIKPHQLQAATWISQQRKNGEKDLEMGKKSRAASNAQSAFEHFQSYMGEHHPELLGMVPGTGHRLESHPDMPDDVKHSIEMAEENGKTITN